MITVEEITPEKAKSIVNATLTQINTCDKESQKKTSKAIFAEFKAQFSDEKIDSIDTTEEAQRAVKECIDTLFRLEGTKHFAHLRDILIQQLGVADADAKSHAPQSNMSFLQRDPELRRQAGTANAMRALATRIGEQLPATEASERTPLLAS